MTCDFPLRAKRAGGLLSAHALSGRKIFLQRAQANTAELLNMTIEIVSFPMKNGDFL